MKKLIKTLILITLIFAFSSSVFCYSVFAADNVTQLQLAHDNAEAAINAQTTSPVGDPYYEVNSYQAFFDIITDLGGLVGIQAVIDDPISLQTEVDTLTITINNALNGLILDDTYSSTYDNFVAANSIDLTPYTSSSQNLYNDEMDRIEAILNNHTAGESTLQSLNDDIMNASSLLVLQADKSNLIFLNQLLIQAYYENIQLYTASSHNLFKTACDAFGSYLYVNSVIADDNATEASVEALEASIQNALDLLVLNVDNTGLLVVYYELRDTDLSEYTANSQTAYLEELNRLYEIIVGRELDFETAAQVLLDLSELNELLVDLADYTELQSVYDSLSIYREEDYSASSYSILISAKTYAEYMLSNLNATQEELNETIILINDSVEALEQTIETIYLRENNTIDIMQFITLGDSTVTSLDIEDSNIITVDSEGIVTGLKYGLTNITVNLSNGAKEVIDIKVEARLKLPVYIMTFSVPVVAAGLASLLLFSKKETWANIIISIKKIFKKK